MDFNVGGGETTPGIEASFSVGGGETTPGIDFSVGGGETTPGIDAIFSVGGGETTPGMDFNVGGGETTPGMEASFNVGGGETTPGIDFRRVLFRSRRELISASAVEIPRLGSKPASMWEAAKQHQGSRMRSGRKPGAWKALPLR